MEDWTDPEVARTWDAVNTTYNPTRLEQLDILLTLIEDEYKPDHYILDVGMGSGQVEEMLFRRIPDVRVVGTDFSEPMLALARERLAPYSDRYEIAHQDLRRASEAVLPAHRYNIAFSVQVIHNVAHEYKKDAFGFVYQSLMPGGLFLLMDRIRVSTPGLFGAYGSLWDRLDNRARVRHREGSTFEEHEESVAGRGDQPATLEEHLDWLREAGFAEVAVLHLHGNRALFACRK